MKKIILLNKKEGQTPLQALEFYRSKNKAYKDVPMTYAGRLDPMASGVLLILAGEEAKSKDKYLSLDKEYEFQVLFGFATDTYDILGKVVVAGKELTKNEKQLTLAIKKNLKYFKGNFVQEYPAYSSRTVAGKPLFEYARAGEDVVAPKREVNVKSIKLQKVKKIKGQKLLEDIKKRISLVDGDFRQKEIIKTWDKNLGKNGEQFFLASFHVKCGSGTYVRSISNSLGEKMGIPALAYSIKRTKLGKWRL